MVAVVVVMAGNQKVHSMGVRLTAEGEERREDMREGQEDHRVNMDKSVKPPLSPALPLLPLLPLLPTPPPPRSLLLSNRLNSVVRRLSVALSTV